MEEKIDPVVFPLDIRLMLDDIEMTRFRGRLKNTTVFQDLTDELQARMLPVIELLERMGIQQVIFDEQMDPPFMVDGESADLQFDDQPSALETLRLSAWWIERKRRRAIIWYRVGTTKDPRWLKWQCLDCNEPVSIDRTHCKNPECPSWEKLHLATGEVTIQLVQNQTTA